MISLEETPKIFESSSTLENSGIFIDLSISSFSSIISDFNFDFLYTFFFFLVPIAASVSLTLVSTFLEDFSVLPFGLFSNFVEPG